MAGSLNGVRQRVDDSVRAQQPLAEAVFDELAAGTHDGVGITRASYGEGEQFAHALFARQARALDLELATDPAGNTYLTLPGADRGAPPVIIGSHLDSVAQGGNFDGAAGVVSGLTALVGLREAGVVPPQDLRVMGIRAEESAWFGVSYIGSRSALGCLPAGALDNARRADTGRSLREHMRECGCAPEVIESEAPYLPPASLGAYLEVHIEQGPVLEEAGIPVGVVTGIRGNRRLPAARCIGEYSHCGGVPRSHRRDAVMATTMLLAELDAIWRECEVDGRDFAFTVGKLFTDANWHAMTKIAGELSFSLDMRSLDPEFLAGMETRLAELATRIGDERGVRFELGEFTRAAPGLLDAGIRASLNDLVQRLQIPSMAIASGASHDAAAFADAGVPTAMIFIRNANGSHNPDEQMAIDDFMQATRLLAAWLVREA
ncbi:MAG: hydantoinase/carbamoylase family amidase [Gammaproteobacteria bacterium]|nr:hydantoinase/carbamoylase family amidase [Gammaproteobacteria bacterium]